MNSGAHFSQIRLMCNYFFSVGRLTEPRNALLLFDSGIYLLPLCGGGWVEVRGFRVYADFLSTYTRRYFWSSFCFIFECRRLSANLLFEIFFQQQNRYSNRGRRNERKCISVIVIYLLLFQ